jgi:hypothetical protein
VSYQDEQLLVKSSSLLRVKEERKTGFNFLSKCTEQRTLSLQSYPQDVFILKFKKTCQSVFLLLSWAMENE